METEKNDLEAVGTELPYNAVPRSGFMIMGSRECSVGPGGRC